MKCRHCGENISRLDKDVCPFCGGLKPLEGVSNQTEDITKALESIDAGEKKKVSVKHRLVAFFLELFLGIFGADAFYLGKWIRGLIAIAITVLGTGILGLIIFLIGLHNPLAFLIPFWTIMLAHALLSMNYLFRHDIKDGKGVYLK